MMTLAEERAARDELDARIALIYAANRPLLARGFALFVFRQGHGARVPDTIDGKKVSRAGMTWQALGRELYGDDFVKELKALAAAKAKT